jgi:hypothetical protein
MTRAERILAAYGAGCLVILWTVGCWPCGS